MHYDNHSLSNTLHSPDHSLVGAAAVPKDALDTLLQSMFADLREASSTVKQLTFNPAGMYIGGCPVRLWLLNINVSQRSHLYILIHSFVLKADSHRTSLLFIPIVITSIIQISKKMTI